MSIIRFNKDSSIHACKVSRIANNIVELYLNEDVELQVVMSGFMVLNEYNFSVMGDYTDYITIYQPYEDDCKHFRLSNDGSVYVVPTPIPALEPYIPTEKEIAEQERYKKIEYDMDELHQERQAIRNQINALEEKVNELYGIPKNINVPEESIENEE